MKTGVYQIKNIINGNIYIGSAAGKGFIGRWKLHIKTLNNNTHHNSRLQNAWNKHGAKNFLFSIIEECNPDKCLIREQFYIDKLNPEYNIYKIAGSPKGRVVSDETKKKISNSLKGRTLSESQKQKISLSLKNKPKSKEHVSKVKSILWGKNGKLRKIKGGRFSGYYTFFNLKTKEKVNFSKFEFADKYNLDRSSVYKLCNGKRKILNKQWVCVGKDL